MINIARCRLLSVGAYERADEDEGEHTRDEDGLFAVGGSVVTGVRFFSFYT